MNQKYIFLSEEGDRWFERNREKLASYDIEMDPVIAMMRRLDIKPKRVLEIGCGDGRRLATLREAYKCEIMGVEPSMKAAGAAAERRVPVIQSSASSLPISGVFDLIIYGFALYLTDPNDWLLIAAEADHVLTPNGHIIVHDFARPCQPFKRPYEHRSGAWSYHFDWAKLWLSHPAYSVVVRHQHSKEEEVAALHKGFGVRSTHQ